MSGTLHTCPTPSPGCLRSGDVLRMLPAKSWGLASRLSCATSSGSLQAPASYFFQLSTIHVCVLLALDSSLPEVS